MGRALEKVTFAGHSHAQLAGRIDRPKGPTRGWALFAHCFTCSKDLNGARAIASELADRGFAVLRFDFTGLGHSEGEFAETNFSSNVEDLVAAANYLREQHQAPSLLVGHSLGGAAVLAVAKHIPEVKAVATIGAPSSAAHVQAQFHADLATIETEGSARVSLSGRPFTITRQFLDDVREQNLAHDIAHLRRALLVCHAPQDEVVGIANATDIFVAAKHPKSFLSLDSADHLLTRREDAAYAATAIAAWAQRYVPLNDPGEADTDLPTGPNGVLVAETGEGRFQNRVVSHQGHTMLADEPASFGGDDTGPSPYQYLNAALGACTSMTVRMYAERKGWPLESVDVRLTQEKTHADDCAQCDENEKARVDVIERTITFKGDLSEEQRARLLEIADKCPVHRTLNSPVVIRSRLAEADADSQSQPTGA